MTSWSAEEDETPVGLLNGFTAIGLVIALGALLAHLRIAGEGTQRELLSVAFFVASPALLMTTIAEADLGGTVVGGLVVAAASYVVTAAAFMAWGRWRRRRELGDLVVGGMAVAYVNAGNLGLPIAGYVLGDPVAIAPVLLFQMLVAQPLSLLVLDARVPGRRTGWRATLVRPLRNPLTVGALLGVLLAATGWRLPTMIQDPVELVGDLAIPAMLIAYGISLRLGPGLAGEGSRVELGVAALCKLVLMPVAAWAVAHLVLGMEGPALLAAVVCAALPTAQNIFLHASRYGRLQVLVRDTILVTTLLSVPVLLLVVLVLG